MNMKITIGWHYLVIPDASEEVVKAIQRAFQIEHGWIDGNKHDYVIEKDIIIEIIKDKDIPVLTEREFQEAKADALANAESVKISE